MFVMTAKLSKTKLLAAAFLVVAAILLIAMLVSGSGGEAEQAPPIGDTNDSRVAYLATFGWSVNAQPTQTQQVKIPESADSKVFARYNDLQLSQGFDLTQYAGKEVTRYVYEVLNYPEATSPVYASVLVFEGNIIGGDITDSAQDGVIHGFQKPSGLPEATQPAPSETEAATEETVAESLSAG